MEEKWINHPTYKKYLISDFGNVRHINNYNTRKAREDKDGYLRINIHHDDRLITILIHREVALCFFGERNNGEVINHIDGNKKNNHKSNLEYVTNQENIIHACRTGLVKKCIPVTINGVRYYSKREAERLLGIRRYNI